MYYIVDLYVSDLVLLLQLYNEFSTICGEDVGEIMKESWTKYVSILLKLESKEELEGELASLTALQILDRELQSGWGGGGGLQRCREPVSYEVCVHKSTKL